MPIQRRGRGEDILFLSRRFLFVVVVSSPGTPPPPLDGEPASPQRPTRLPPPLLLAINEDIARLESLENIFACSFVRSFVRVRRTLLKVFLFFSRFVLDFALVSPSSSFFFFFVCLLSFFFLSCFFFLRRRRREEGEGEREDFFFLFCFVLEEEEEEEERKKVSVDVQGPQKR